MKIVQVVSLEERVPPKKYGGTELVAHNVTEELHRRGHEVYLLATGDSQTQATLVSVIDKPIREMYAQSELPVWRDYWKMASVSKFIDLFNEIKPDVIHNHFAWRLLLFSKLIKFPMMSTIHGPLTSPKERTTYTAFSSQNYISISDNQRKALPGINWVQTVYNGIDITSFPVKRSAGGTYFLFLGRTSPEKGLKEIIQLILNSDYSLKIAAKVDTIDQPYFDTHVEPYVDGKKIEFLGEVDHTKKSKLLKDASALLLWLNWEEPFGLVVAEAMACGTPVIVNPRGSMPELIDHEKTGFLVNSLEEMKSALARVERINPLECRQRVERKFSIKAMTDGYEAVANQLINDHHT